MFQGFSQEAIDFLWGIRFNNERSWFEAHKSEYQDFLYRPMCALSNQIYDLFQGAHTDLDLIRRVSRIYRDARRLHGRGPYKDHLWLSMEAPRELPSAHPSFWFELSPEGWSYGLGYWMAPPITMAKLRARIDADPAPLEEIVRTLNRQGVFTLNGEDYKRSKGNPGPLLAPWYNKKNFSLACRHGHEEPLFSPALADTLLEGYEQLLPLYRWLLKLEGDPAPAAFQ